LKTVLLHAVGESPQTGEGDSISAFRSPNFIIHGRFFRFAQLKWAVAEDGAALAQQNTTYCGSCLTCTTDSGIFASAAVNKR
jgi:hypothetical protein